MTPNAASSTEPRVWLPTVRTATGAEVYTERLAQSLRTRGVQAEVTWLPHRAEYLPHSVRFPKPPPWANIVHVNSWLPLRFIPERLPLVATVHHVVHGAPGWFYRTPVQRLYHRVVIQPREVRILERATIVTTVSQRSAAQMANVFGYRRSDIIPNWVDTDLFRPKRHKYSQGPFRLLFVGTWSSRKGVDLLPEIMEHLGNSFELQVVSEVAWRARAKWPKNMHALRGRKPLSEEELVAAYQAADALLFPSRLEGFGLTVLEAMACGLPIVAVHEPAVSETIGDSQCAILCPQDDIASMVEAIREIADAHDRRKRMAEAGRQRAVQVFSPEATTDRYIGVYQRALAPEE